MTYTRIASIDLPIKQSAFLWGARKTGKSTFLKTHYHGAAYFDLLKSEEFIRFLKAPELFRAEVLALSEQQLKLPVIVDEVQKIPALLDEIHWLIENSNAYFIMCGSSTRKLRSAGVNLLGGRAWSYYFYPLVYPEITDFDLLKVLNMGTMPSHYNSINPRKSLKAYVKDYLIQEIQVEGLVRNLPAFARFIDSLAFSDGELVNYTNISRECGIDVKTVREYYQILVDTLIGYYLLPYYKRPGRNTISSTPKFYLFDVGLSSIIAKRSIPELRGSEAGKALESYIMHELTAYKGIKDLDFDIRYWRTKSGLEVDFILGDAQVAVEVKVSNDPRTTELRGLAEFAQEYGTKKCYVVCTVPKARKVEVRGVVIDLLPVEKFLRKLWDGEVI